jgi:replication factor C small subunit
MKENILNLPLKELIYTEAYRPTIFDDLIFNEKNKLLEYLKNPKSLPSFIFYSSKPGTGKSSCARIIINTLGCDNLSINASEERGIDTIREKINQFSRCMSFNTEIKRCVHLDEADGTTKQAQDSLRNLMEEYSNNAFFIFCCNDVSKIIEPIRSRCVVFNFNKPDKDLIFNRLKLINEKEETNLKETEIQKLIQIFYPDIRSMIMSIQDTKMGGGIDVMNKLFGEALIKLKNKDIQYFKEKIYSQELDLFRFNNFLFDYFFANHKVLGLEKTGKILLLLADTEKSLNIGCNLEIVFTANLLEIMKNL